MKLLAINGSARRNGNTYWALQKVCENVESNDIITEVIDVGSLNIHACIACKRCWENRNSRCVLDNDGVNGIIKQMVEADAIVVGAPAYCGGVPGGLKTFMDRVAFVSFANGGLFNRKVGASLAMARRAGGIPVTNTINSFFSVAGMIIVGAGYWNVLHGTADDAVQEDNEGFQMIDHLSKNIEWTMRSFENSRGTVDELKIKKYAYSASTL